MDEKIKHDFPEQFHNNADRRLTTARRKSLSGNRNNVLENSLHLYSFKQKKDPLAEFEEESTGDTGEQTFQSSRKSSLRKSIESPSQISQTPSRRKSILKINEAFSYSPQALSRKSILIVKSSSESPLSHTSSNSGIEPPGVSQLSVDLPLNASSVNASKDSHLDDLFYVTDLSIM